MHQIADDMNGERVRIVYAKTPSAPLMEVVGHFMHHINPDGRGEEVILSLRPIAGSTKIDGRWIREVWLTDRAIQLPKRYTGETRLY